MNSDQKFHKKKRILISRFFVLVLGTLLLFTGSYWEFADMWSSLLFLVGLFLVGIATIGRMWCSIYIAGYKTNTLITSGPYSLCRNPLYFFSLLGAIGIGLATETLIIPVVIIIAFACYYPLVIKHEEQRLREVHKDEYDNYCKRTPSFFPSFKLYTEPPEYTVNSKALRENLLDAMWFIWIVGILELIEALHETDILPVVFKLY